MDSGWSNSHRKARSGCHGLYSTRVLDDGCGTRVEYNPRHPMIDLRLPPQSIMSHSGFDWTVDRILREMSFTWPKNRPQAKSKRW